MPRQAPTTAAHPNDQLLIGPRVWPELVERARRVAFRYNDAPPRARQSPLHELQLNTDPLTLQARHCAGPDANVPGEPLL